MVVYDDYNTLFVNLAFYLEAQRGKYDLEVINRTIDFCDFLLHRESDPFVNIIFKVLSQYSNIPEQCPIKKVSEHIFF